MNMKILMAEDLEPMREHLSGLMAEAGDIELRVVSQDASQVMRTAAAWRPDVIILDIRMRVMRTLDVLEILKKEWPATAVAVSALVFPSDYRELCLGQGADFFFDKSLEWNELMAFLHQRRAQAAADLVDAAPAPATAPIQCREQPY